MVALVGPLGAGKTAFVKGLAEGLGVDAGAVASPTFVIANELPASGGRTLVHADLFRIGSVDELEAAGLHDWLGPGRVLAVEWADRLPGALPGEGLWIAFERVPGEPSVRVLQARASGAAAVDALARWRETLAAQPPADVETAWD